MQIMAMPTVLCPFFLYYTDGISLLFSITSIVFALLSDRGIQLPYVFASAVYTALAVGVRQTNIILCVLNPALIVLLRVMITISIHCSMGCFIVMKNILLLVLN